MTVRRTRARAASARTASREEATRRSTTSNAYGGETTEDEELERTQFPAGVEPAFLRVGVGQTYNLGNYESLRIDVSVTIPCMPDEASLNRAYRRASDFVAEKLNEEETQWARPSKSSR